MTFEASSSPASSSAAPVTANATFTTAPMTSVTRAVSDVFGGISRRGAVSSFWVGKNGGGGWGGGGGVGTRDRACRRSLCAAGVGIFPIWKMFLAVVFGRDGALIYCCIHLFKPLISLPWIRPLRWRLVSHGHMNYCLRTAMSNVCHCPRQIHSTRLKLEICMFAIYLC